MSKCHYHPDARGTATCPNCRQAICDRCRLNGTSLRCGVCQSSYSKGNAAAANSSRVLCTNHKDIPTEQKCSQCRKPHCVACLNSQNRCYRCVQKDDRVPAGLAGRKMGKNPRGTGALQRTPTGKLTMAGVAEPRGLPRRVKVGLGTAGAVIAIVVGSLAMHPGKPKAPYTGPAGISIVAPAAGGVFRGAQSIKFQVRAATELDRVEVMIDGKYWDRLTKAPFQSDWPTAIFKNGRHVITAKAVYRGAKRTASARRVVKTRNAVHKLKPGR